MSGFPEGADYDETMNDRFSFARIHRDLSAQLYTYPFVQAEGISQLLSAEPVPINRELSATHVKALLIEKGVALTPGQKAHAAREVLRAYPDEFLDDEPLPSPKQYCKNNSLSGTVRANLKPVLETTIVDSKSTLAKELTRGEFEDCGLSISDDEINRAVTEYLEDRDASVINRAANLKEVYPETGDPLEAQLYLASLGVRYMVPPGKFVAERPKTTREMYLVKSAFVSLERELERYETDDERVIAAAIAQSLEPILTERLSGYFQGIYEELAHEQVSQLRPAVAAAYDRATGQEATYQAPARPAVFEPEAEDAGQSDTQTAIATESKDTGSNPNDYEIIPLDTIAIDLPWAEKNNFGVQLMKQNGNSFLFFTAFSPKASAISQNLRRQPPDAEAFDQMWEQARRIELTDLRGRHPYIDKVSNVTTPGLNELVIVRYGNLQSNAKRTYYAKTNAGRYPELAGLLDQHQLTPDTPLLIHIGETDKANQLRLYGDFGISRAIARSKNVGSV